MEFIKITEQPSLYDGLDKKSVKEILEDINTEDHKVADAVQKAIPQIEKLVTLIIPRVKKVGRIFYMGGRNKRAFGCTRRFRNTSDFRYASHRSYRTNRRRRYRLAQSRRECGR